MSQINPAGRAAAWDGMWMESSALLKAAASPVLTGAAAGGLS